MWAPMRATAKPFDTQAKCVAAVESGQVKAYVVDQSLLKSEVLSNDKVKIVGDTFAEDPYLEGVLREYFPPALVERFGEHLESHPLRQEIICTRVANELVETAGITHVFRAQEETGAGVDAIARAFIVSRELFDIGYAAQMHRDLREATTKEGLVVDVRYNSGGHTSQLVTDRIARRVLSWDYPRHERPGTYPAFATHGAVVLVTNPEKVRARIADLEATDREFLEAGWEAAAMGAEGPVAVEGLDVSASSYRSYESLEISARKAGNAWWTFAPPGMFAADDAATLPLEFEAAPAPKGDPKAIEQFYATLKLHIGQNHGKVAFVAPAKGTIDRMAERLREHGISARIAARFVRAGLNVLS